MPRKSNSRSADGSSAAASLREVVVEQARIEALDRDAVLEVFLEGALVGGLERADAVAHDVPAEDFLVDVGELDAAGELGEVGVAARSASSS